MIRASAFFSGLALAIWFPTPTATERPDEGFPTPERIKQVASELVCLCGSCNRESLATCVCTAFAVPEREGIGRQLTSGMSPEEIVASYVERFGNSVLAEPPPGGARWISRLTPVVVLTAGILAVLAVLHRWLRRNVDRVAESPPRSGDRSGYESRLREELSRMDRE